MARLVWRLNEPEIAAKGFFAMTLLHSSRDNPDNLKQRRSILRRILYQKRKDQGVCASCGRERRLGHRECEKCIAAKEKYREANRQREHSRFLRRKALGVCVGCGGQRDSEFDRCFKCRIACGISRAKIRGEGRCVTCGEPSGKISRCPACRDKRRIALKKHVEKGGCGCGRNYVLPNRKTCQECVDRARRNYRALKVEVFNHYGGQRCVCCGETTYEFLQLDHINNDGAEHRRRLGNKGVNMILWVKKNGFPSGFQVLCANCNWAKGMHDGCPHDKQ